MPLIVTLRTPPTHMCCASQIQRTHSSTTPASTQQCLVCVCVCACVCVCVRFSPWLAQCRFLTDHDTSGSSQHRRACGLCLRSGPRPPRCGLRTSTRQCCAVTRPPCSCLCPRCDPRTPPRMPPRHCTAFCAFTPPLMTHHVQPAGARKNEHTVSLRRSLTTSADFWRC